MNRSLYFVLFCMTLWGCTGDNEQKNLAVKTTALSSGGSKSIKASEPCGVTQKLDKRLRKTMRSLYSKARKSQERNRRASIQMKKQWKQQQLHKRKLQKRWNPPKVSSGYLLLINKRRSNFRKEETKLKGLYKQQPNLLETKTRQRKREMLFQDNEWLKHLKRK